jgi:protease II
MRFQGIFHLSALVSVAATLATAGWSQPFGPSANAPATANSTAELPDNYQWLEDVHGERAMTWVKAENERTAKILEADPRFDQYKAEALKILESPDRIAYPVFRDGAIYNTWQDAEHVRGIVRRTTLADYLTPQPHWQTILDYDALAKADNEKWVQHGLNCLYPGNSICLAGLSAGGEDADTQREFDLRTEKFVAGGHGRSCQRIRPERRAGSPRHNPGPFYRFLFQRVLRPHPSRRQAPWLARQEQH